MNPLATIGGYLGLHLVACQVLASTRPRWRTEPGIFALHAVPYAASLGAAEGLLGWRPAWVAVLAGLHGIYSLSFLELWSLTQGSFSLALLARVRDLGPHATAAGLAPLAAIGHRKSEVRGVALASLGLAIGPGDGGARRLTPLGRICARLLWGLRTLTNGRTLNP